MKRWQKGLLGLLAGLLAALATTFFAGHFFLAPSSTVIPFDLEAIPAFSGEPWVEINGNVPYFEEDEPTGESFERYSDLDRLPARGLDGANILPGPGGHQILADTGVGHPAAVQAV